MNESIALNRAVGAIGLVGCLGVVVVLGVHPPGTTELYDDGPAFLDHVNGFWIVIHLLAIPALLTFVPVIRQWSNTLSDGYATAFARFAGHVATLGTAIGALHLAGFDTLTFYAFADTFMAAGESEASLVAADLLLRLHAASLVSWMMAYWLPLSALVAAALIADGRRPVWVRLLGPVATIGHLVAIIAFVSERQHTTFGETIAFRTGVTLQIALVAIMAVELRRGAPAGHPKQL